MKACVHNHTGLFACMHRPAASPGRVLKDLFPDQSIGELQESLWWYLVKDLMWQESVMSMLEPGLVGATAAKDMKLIPTCAS